MSESPSLSKSSLLGGVGGAVVAISAVLKILLTSLDSTSTAQLFANQGIAVGFFLFAIALVFGKKKINLTFSTWAMILFVAWVAIRAMNGVGVSWMLEVASSLSVAVTVGYFLQFPMSKRIVVGLFAGVVSVVFVWVVGQEFLSLPELRESGIQLANNVSPEMKAEFLDRLMTAEVFGPFTISNALAAFSILFFFPFAFLFYALLREGKGWKVAIIPAFPAFFALSSLLLTRSKGGFLAFGFGLILAVFFALKKTKVSNKARVTLLVAPIICGLIALVALITVAPAQYGKASAAVRAGYYSASVMMIADSPISGHGTGTFADNYPRFKAANAGEVKHAHNDFLEIFAETGIIGLLLFLLSFALALVEAFKLKDSPSNSVPNVAGDNSYVVDKYANPVSERKRGAILSALLLWLGISIAIAMFGSCDFDLVISHVRDGEVIWILLLLFNVVIPPAIAFAIAGLERLPQLNWYLKAGLLSGVAAFLAHSMIDFNLYNEGSTLAFFAAFGLLMLSGKTRSIRYVSHILAIVLAIAIFLLSGVLKETRVEQKNIESYVNSIEHGGQVSKKEEQFLLKMLSNTQNPYAIASPKLFVARGDLCTSLTKHNSDFLKLAFIYYEKAALIAPNRYTIRASMAKTAMQLGMQDVALEQFSLATSFAPKNAKLLCEFIEFLLEIGDDETACKYYLKMQGLVKNKLPQRQMPDQEKLKVLAEKIEALQQ